MASLWGRHVLGLGVLMVAAACLPACDSRMACAGGATPGASCQVAQPHACCSKTQAIIPRRQPAAVTSPPSFCAPHLPCASALSNSKPCLPCNILECMEAVCDELAIFCIGLPPLMISIRVSLSVRVCVCACVCMCVCLYVCMCVYVCLCVLERESERKRPRLQFFAQRIAQRDIRIDYTGKLEFRRSELTIQCAW